MAVLWAVAFGILIGVLWGQVRKPDCLFTKLYHVANIAGSIPQTIVRIRFSYILRPWERWKRPKRNYRAGDTCLKCNEKP